MNRDQASAHIANRVVAHGPAGRGGLFAGVLVVLLCLPSCGRKVDNPYHDEVNVTAKNGGKDLVMTLDEVERHERFSIVRVRYVSGASVPSAMFIVKGLRRMAMLRGVACFINLKEWQGGEKDWFYKVGFSSDNTVDPRTYFGDDIDISKSLEFMSVAQFGVVFGDEKEGKPSPAK